MKVFYKKKIFYVICIVFFCFFTISNGKCFAKESENTYLSNLTINQEGLTPNFDKNNLNYYIFLKTSINKLEVNATPEDNTSNVEIKGNNNLVVGDNKIEIIVTSKNNEKKTYTINVIKTDNFNKSNSYLQNLILENIELTPEFQPYIFEYDGGTIASDVNKILLFAAGYEENAKIEISGNENLQEGENYIKVKVTSEDNLIYREYKVKITKLSNKTTVDLQKDSINNTLNEKNNNSDKVMGYDFKIESIIIIILVIIVIILIIVIIKSRKLKR